MSDKEPQVNLTSFSPEHSWLKESFAQITRSFDADKLPHGLLLVAPNQSGKSLLAMSLAKSLLCEQSKQQFSQACGECKSCKLIDAQSHPDLSRVDCLVDSKGKQKKSIGIDQIRQLTGKLVETSQLGGWRIAIIMSVEKMTRGAFNALLKTLEEPGDNTLVLLLANSLQQVPATIKSRCQLMQLKLTEKQLVPWLTQAAQCDELTALRALNQCHFAPFAALTYIREGTEKTLETFNQGLNKVLANELTAEEFLNEYSHLDDTLWIQLAKYFKNVQLSVLKLDKDQNSDQNIYQKVPKNIASQLYAQLIEYNRAQCAGSNLQSNLQLEAILIQWFEIGRKIVHYSNR